MVLRVDMTRKATFLALTLIFAATISASAQTDCSDHRAWPDGPHLSEKNDFIVDLFNAVWGDKACEQWAGEHRLSAVKGLRKLGYEVTAPVAPVLQVDELTFRGTDNALNERVTLGEGCYAIWLNTPDQTPEQILAIHQASVQERNQFWANRGHPIDFNLNLWLFDPEDPEDMTNIAASDSFWGIMFVTNNPSDKAVWDRVRQIPGSFALKPGEWGYQVQIGWRYPGTEWELRFIPIDYTIAPWDTYWADAPPLPYNPQAEALKCPVGI